MTGSRAGRTVAVVICTYSEDRFGELCAAVESVMGQSRSADEIVVVVDNNPPLFERVERELVGVRVVANANRRGLSGAKNTGLRVSRSDLVAFLDDDAVAETLWLERLVTQVERQDVAVAGGAVIPAWSEDAPAWFPGLFGWVVGCDYDGLPAEASAVRNVFGGNMIVRRDVALAVGGFREDAGRVGTAPLGCEETEFCLRVRSETGACVIRDPCARIHHRVPRERARVAYIVRRCYYEGYSKARITVRADPDALDPERTYAYALARAALGDGRRVVVRLDRTAAMRGAVMIAGGIAAALGFASGRLWPSATH